MKLLLYCIKAKPYLKRYWFNGDNGSGFNYETSYCQNEEKECEENLNGKTVAECDFEVEEIFEDNLEDARDGYVEHFYTLKSYDDFDEGENVLLKESCLQKHELSNYLGFENGYAIHIKNLNVFDKPKELGKALIYNFNTQYIVEKAPQNMMKVYNRAGECLILISIKPEWLCKILNGEKTIEVRKKVLKGMLE